MIEITRNRDAGGSYTASRSRAANEHGNEGGGLAPVRTFQLLAVPGHDRFRKVGCFRAQQAALPLPRDRGSGRNGRSRR